MKKSPETVGVKNASAKVPAPTPPAPVKNYSLQLIAWTTIEPFKHVTVGEIDISPGNACTLKEKSKRAGDHVCRGEPTFEKLLNIGLQAMLNDFPACELEDSVAANNALLQLVAEHMELNRMDSGVSSFTGGGSGPLCFGIFKLMEMCRERLNQAAGVAS